MESKYYDIIIVGGSYSGLAAAMALGRAMKEVLVIDSHNPCNKQTPFSHNFITQDGKTPRGIRALAKNQVGRYDTVTFFDGLATSGRRTAEGFEIQVASGETFRAVRLIFATGITDSQPPIEGLAECWGISVLHCPFCHGYEIRGEETGILGNGENGYELARLISNWTHDLTLFTNGPSTLTAGQTEKLQEHDIKIIETEVQSLEHADGYVQLVQCKDGTVHPVKAIYIRTGFQQQSRIPASLGCELTEDGFIKVDAFQETTVSGIFASGDNSSRFRTLANAVATGTTAGMTASKKMIVEQF